MLFLLIYRGYENSGLPHDQEVALAQLGIEAWKDNPRIKVQYGFAGQRSCMAIWEGDSEDDLHKDILTNPAARLGGWEIQLLVSFESMARTAFADAESQVLAMNRIAELDGS